MPYKDPEVQRARVRELLRERRANEPGYSTSKNARYNAANREKYLARKAVARAIAAGKLVRQPCCRCGSAQAEAHHEDYSRPLDVVWLCHPHHVGRHQELKAA